MLLIECPWCGARDEVEFRCGGPAEVRYPPAPDEFDDRAWSRFLYVHPNPCGHLEELWVHSAGCRRWFALVRDTQTHAVAGSYPLTGGPGHG